MRAVFLDFLSPYFALYGTAEWSFKQNITGIMTGLDHGSGLLLMQTMLTVYPHLFLLTPAINILACFSLRKSFGFLACLVWFLPGLLSVCGFLNVLMEVPDSYYVGSGVRYVGEVKSTSINMLCLLVFGWSFFTLIVHAFKIGKAFKDLYDHLWYFIGLSAVLFFVFESDASFFQQELNEYEEDITVTLQTINSQLEFANAECIANHDSLRNQGISTSFCGTVDLLYRRYLFLVEQKSFSRQYHDLSIIGDLIDKNFMLDMARFNRYECLLAKSSSCKSVPFDSVKFSIGFDEFEPVALAIVPLHETLIELWGEAVKVNAKLEPSLKHSHLRWVFFLFLSFIVGGKISNTTRSLVGDPAPVFRPSLVRGWGWLVKFLQNSWEFSSARVRRLVAFYHQIKGHPVVIAYGRRRRRLHERLTRFRNGVPNYVWVFFALLCCFLFVYAFALSWVMPSWSVIIREGVSLFIQDPLKGLCFIFLIFSVTVFKSTIFGGPFLFIRAAMGNETRKVHSPLAWLRDKSYRRFGKRFWKPFSWLLKP